MTLTVAVASTGGLASVPFSTTGPPASADDSTSSAVTADITTVVPVTSGAVVSIDNTNAPLCAVSIPPVVSV